MYSDYPGSNTRQLVEAHNGQCISHKITTLSTPKLPETIRFRMKLD